MQFERGFKDVRTKIEKNAKYNRDCNNCAYFYKAQGDAEELCNNESVLSYDICTEGNRVYCCYWKSLSEV